MPRRRVLLAFVAFLAASRALGAETVLELPGHRLEVRWAPVPVALSGTLDPWLLTLDGAQIEAREEGFAAVLLGGNEVERQALPHAPFFARSDADELKISARSRKGSVVELRALKLPVLRSLRLGDSGMLLATLDGVFDEFHWDGRLRAMTVLPDGAREVELPVDGKSLAEEGGSHYVELRGAPLAPGRTYNIEFSGTRMLEFPDQYLGIGVGDGFVGGGLSLSFARELWRRWRAGIYVNKGKEYGSYETSSWDNSGYSARIRGGYFPFRASRRLFDARRFEAGLVVGMDWYHREWHDTRWGGSSGSEDGRSSFTGIFARWEPLRWRWIAAAVNMDAVWLWTARQKSVRPTLEVCFHF